ncbi:MAG TPA: ion channel [Pyrinomonadaceae bacterium]
MHDDASLPWITRWMLAVAAPLQHITGPLSNAKVNLSAVGLLTIQVLGSLAVSAVTGGGSPLLGTPRIISWGTISVGGLTLFAYVFLLVYVGWLMDPRQGLFRIFVHTDQRSHPVTAFAAVLLLLSTVIFFGNLYTLIYLNDFNAFSMSTKPAQEHVVSTFIYFSAVTMMTVGYGDIVPVSMVARALVLLQLAVGFVLIVGVIASVISMQTSRSEAVIKREQRNGSAE